MRKLLKIFRISIVFLVIFSWFFGDYQLILDKPVMFSQVRIASAASIGPNNPSAADGTSQAGGGTITWTNPTYVFSSDNTRATAALAKGVISYYLQATGFNFNIPSDATINGIVVEVERSIFEATTYTKDNSIKIIQGGVISGTDHLDTTITWPASSADAYKTYASSTDLWGLTWTPTQINASNFGVAVQAINTKVNAAFTNTAQVDHIRITVYYTIPTYAQSHYRFFQNLDSTDVGNYLAAQDTGASLNSTGQAFRLRLLMSVDTSDLVQNGQNFKLQFAQIGADNLCDTSFSGETYADATNTSVIAYNDNPTPTDGAALTANANDPSGTRTIVNQTYEEANNFTNSVAAIPAGQDGKWDFALKDNGASSSTAYCLRVVKSDNTLLDTYSYIPQITTAPTTIISVSVSDGVIDYGILPKNSSKSTCDLTDTQIVTNNGNVAETFNIMGSTSTNWTLGTTPGTDIYVHKFSTSTCPITWGGVALTTSYQTMATNIAASATSTLNLQINTPNPSSVYTQQSINVTVQATAF